MRFKTGTGRLLAKVLPRKIWKRQVYKNKYRELIKTNHEMNERLKSNLQFKDLHKGKRCFVLGNGPSLLSVDLSLLKDEITFTVNDLFYMKEFEKINTTYHLFADPAYFIKMDEIMDKITETVSPSIIFAEINGYKYIRQEELDSKYHIAYFANGIEVDDLDFMEIDMTYFLPYFCTVVQGAISIAMYMGCTEIYLLGCDCTGIMNYIERVQGKEMSFYAFDLSAEEQKKMYEQIDITSEHIFFEWHHIFKSYGILDKIARKKQIRIINLTQGGILDSLEKGKLKDVFNPHEKIADTETEWSMVIKPKTSWFDIDLRELWQYRDLIRLFVRRNYTATYKQTILGPLWFVINPLITVITFTIVFGNIANIPTDGVPKFLFYMAGNTLWAYFSSCLTSTATTFTSNAAIFGKVYFPRMTIPLSTVIFGLLSFVIQIAIFLGFIIYYILIGSVVLPNLYILLVPFLILEIALLGLGFGIIISSLTTKYRDLSILVSFSVQLWMFATPIVYPASQLSDHLKTLVMLNPMSPIVETFRYAFLGSGSIDFKFLLISLIVTMIVICIGVILFSKVEKTFMDTV